MDWINLFENLFGSNAGDRQNREATGGASRAQQDLAAAQAVVRARQFSGVNFASENSSNLPKLYDLAAKFRNFVNGDSLNPQYWNIAPGIRKMDAADAASVDVYLGSRLVHSQKGTQFAVGAVSGLFEAGVDLGQSIINPKIASEHYGGRERELTSDSFKAATLNEVAEGTAQNLLQPIDRIITGTPAKSGEALGQLAFGAMLGRVGGLGAKRLLKASEITGEGIYAGTKEASEYLKSQGVSRQFRKKIIESFDTKTIEMKVAGDNTYGLRFFDGVNAQAKGRYLFESFDNLTNRENLALPLEWNSMSGIKQWKVRPGTKIITGKAASQLNFGPQYIGGEKQWYIINLDDLIEP